ncbi:MAG: hypothetical protein ACYCXY_11480 [Acidimicrobiales bacterium]
MEAPGLGLTGTGDAIVYISNGKVTLSVQTVSGGAKSVVSEQEIAGTVAQWSAGSVVFADRASLSAVVRQLERSGAEGDRLRARSIACLCRLPLNGQYAILTDVLAVRYVAPGGEADARDVEDLPGHRSPAPHAPGDRRAGEDRRERRGPGHPDGPPGTGGERQERLRDHRAVHRQGR